MLSTLRALDPVEARQEDGNARRHDLVGSGHLARSDLLVQNVRWQVGAIALASTVVTAAFVAVPSLQYGYRAPSLHVALESAATVISLVVAFLAFGRVRREPRLSDLLLTVGFTVLALSTFWFRAVPAAFGADLDGPLVWWVAVDRLCTAALLAAAATLSDRPLRDVRRAMIVGGAASAAIIATTVAVGVPLRSRLPQVLTAAGVDANVSAHPVLDAHPALLAILLLGALLFVAATIGFGERARRRNDLFFVWLALACVLAVFARLNYFLYPSNYTDWVYLGDAFWFGFIALLLIGALCEIASYSRAAAAAAAIEERRRLARDLHDGLAQELAFLRANLPRLDEHECQTELVPRLATAAERAERESRRLLAALSPPATDAFDVLLASVMGEVVIREHIGVDLQAARGVRVDPRHAEALLRIAAEGVSNAARHAGVERVTVRLERLGARVRLSVIDTGCGFDPDHEGRRDGGFGLISMRQRACTISADFSVTSRPGHGTTVQVVA